MVDPTSDLAEDVDEAEAPTCDHCGDPVVNDPDHRVVSWIDDGTARHAHFCDETCLGAWEEE